MNKYTVYGNSEFDEKIDSHMREIRDAVLEVVPEKDLSALILGGGYGRGEGGVFIQGETMELYNDFDFFVISNNIPRSKMREYHSNLQEVSEALSEKIGIDVDFGPFKNISELSTMRFTMMWYELKKAHVVVYGDEDILNRIPDFQADRIPLPEAMGLMLNRAVGLLLAKRRLDESGGFSREDADFVERNITKAAMAAGDAFLICNHTFHHSYVKRMELMEDFKQDALIDDNDFLNIYRNAVMYKLKPERTDQSRARLEDFHGRISSVFKKFFLFTAAACWKVEINDFNDFFTTVSAEVMPDEDPGRRIWLKNILLNAKEVGATSFSLSWYLKYPRYRLFYVVPYFAFSERGCEGGVPSALGVSRDSTDDVKFAKFIKLWERFN